jgi:hypothetical protein
MKKTAIKIIISFLALAIVFGAVQLLSKNHVAKEDGFILLIILDEDGNVLFDNEIPYYIDDTFFDIIDRKFSLTCANRYYQQDPTCSYDFVIMDQRNKVLLGIKGETFEIITDFNQTFIQIEVFKESTFVLATQGVNQLKFEDGSIIKLSVRRVGTYGN